MIRLAEEKEALAILSEPDTVRRVGKNPESCIYQPWIAEQEGHKMLFFFWAVHDFVYEVHIASPKASIIKSRDLAKEIMVWIFSKGASKIITNCPKGKIANMARKMGMTPYKSEGNTIYFEVLSWA